MIMQLFLVLLFREIFFKIILVLYSLLIKKKDIYINITKSYKVSLYYIFYIIRVKNKVLLTIRFKSVIETVVLRILFY